MLSCRHFNGYKPCGKSAICDNLCPQFSPSNIRLLVVHLEALGAVLRSTALLPAIRRKFPNAHLTWVTQKPADQLLANNPYIDRVLTTNTDDLLQLSALEFDIALVVDKGLKSAGVLKQTKVDYIYGFATDLHHGAVVPATDAAKELWEIGLSNQKKFFENRKAETQLAHEALELGPWARDEYVVQFTEAERIEAGRRRSEWSSEGREFVIGLNTGCSGTILAKRLPVDVQREVIARLTALPNVRVVLLGGPEDTLRNQRIGHGLRVVQSPTDRGLRDGLVSVDACDAILTGDSLGMHMGIALKKWIVAWFGPTCAHEIDLYDRGHRILTQASCSPCWKRSCDKSTMCYDMVSVDALVAALLVTPAYRALTTSTLNTTGNDRDQAYEQNSAS